MKKPILLLAGLAVVSLGFPACTNSEGRFRPPDPLGRAIFDALDRGPRYAEADSEYIGVDDRQYTQRDQRPGPDYAWVEGTYGRDARGRQVWIPGHWARIGAR